MVNSLANHGYLPRNGLNISLDDLLVAFTDAVNLDPAAEPFEYEPSIDIRDLISLDDVMTELGYGPNGGLIYCFE